MMVAPVAFVLMVVGAFVLAMFALRKLLFVAAPNEVLIVSGRRTTLEDGKSVGYRWISGGRVFQLPVVETVHWLDTTNLVVHVGVEAWSKGYIPMSFEVVANVRVARDQPQLDRAATRLLGKSRDELTHLARDAILHAAVSIAARHTPEELVEGRATAEDHITHEAAEALQGVGLMLDTLNLGEISDEVGYLDALKQD